MPPLQDGQNSFLQASLYSTSGHQLNTNTNTHNDPLRPSSPTHQTFTVIAEREDGGIPEEPQAVSRLENEALRNAFNRGVHDAPDMLFDNVNVGSDYDTVQSPLSPLDPQSALRKVGHKPLEEVYVKLTSKDQHLGAVLEGNCIVAIQRDSPAHHAGLKKGDVITQIDSTPIAGNHDVLKALQTPKERSSFLGISTGLGYVVLILPKKQKKIHTAKQHSERQRRLEEKRSKRRRERESRGMTGEGEYVTSSSDEEVDRRSAVVIPQNSSTALTSGHLGTYDKAVHKKRRRKTTPGWASVRLSLVRAALTGVLSVLCLVLWFSSDVRADCSRSSMGDWMLVNVFVLFGFALLTVASSTMITKNISFLGGAPVERNGKVSRYTARPALAVSSFLFLWCFVWIILEFYNLSLTSEAECGSMFDSVKAMVGVQFAFIGLIFICFCSMYTQTNDDEEAARAYRSYSPPRGLDRRVGRVIG